MAGGTGQKLTTATTIVAGVAALVATLLSIVVPIYSIASWTSMISLKAAQFVDPVRDIYEAFTIYTFFHLLINYLGGERSLIIMTHGREPVSHLWPMNHVLPRVDISDPHTFLAIKRGILQYAWLKPVLSVASIIMKATGTYQEGYIGLSSGYLWSGIVYNVSVTLSLYSLGLFWVCMHRDLLPFRPVPNVEGYTPDNLAAAIQDALICIEMPVFAVAHWYAFSWHDFADQNVLAARMPVKFAIRDAFGIRDLIEDTKQTFSGDQYNYRIYDSGDKIMPHEESRARLGRLKEGMRYQRGGKGKYWIPTPGQVDRQVNHDLNERDPLLSGTAGGPSEEYNFENGTFHDIDEENKDPEEEELYAKARELEYGDWNYPVITAHEPLRERYARAPDGNYRYQPSRPQGTRTYSQNSHQSSEPAVVSSRPKKQKQKQKQKRIPAPKLSGQGLIPDHSSPTAGPAATSSNVSTPRVQSPKPAHATAAESESAETVAYSKTKDDKKKPAAAPQKQAAPHESSPWANKDESEDETDKRFRVGDEEEFRNVWDGGDQRDR
ncbi:hypothetical protein BN1708_005027 [Verticillium longisporum]|uniref:DUF300 domain protein n=1 Tax=Verticillium longisporum TaxID=100787 RepID=A0A0G4M5R3_VERLO|nr:hypothetical protein BN1708_005027 [Verticillium longisporum]